MKSFDFTRDLTDMQKKRHRQFVRTISDKELGLFGYQKVQKPKKIPL